MVAKAKIGQVESGNRRRPFLISSGDSRIRPPKLLRYSAAVNSQASCMTYKRLYRIQIKRSHPNGWVFSVFWLISVWSAPLGVERLGDLN